MHLILGEEAFFNRRILKTLFVSNKYDVKRILMKFLNDKGFILLSKKPIFVVDKSLEDIKLLFISHLDTLPGDTEKCSFNEEIYCRGAILSRASLASFYYMLSSYENKDVGIGLIFSEEGLYGFRDIHNLSFSMDMKETYVLIGMPTSMQVFSVSKGFLRFRMDIEGIGSLSTIPWYSTNMLRSINKIYENIMRNWPKHNLYPTSPQIFPPYILSFFLLGSRIIYLSSIEYITNSSILPNRASLLIDVSYPPNDDKEDVIKQVRNIIDESVEDNIKYNIYKVIDLPPHMTSPKSHLIHIMKESLKDIVGYEPYFDWYPIPSPSSIISGKGVKDIVIFGPGDYNLIGINDMVKKKNIIDAGRVYRDVINRVGYG